VSWEDDDENHMTSLIVHACGQVPKDPLHVYIVSRHSYFLHCLTFVSYKVTVESAFLFLFFSFFFYHTSLVPLFIFKNKIMLEIVSLEPPLIKTGKEMIVDPVVRLPASVLLANEVDKADARVLTPLAISKGVSEYSLPFALDFYSRILGGVQVTDYETDYNIGNLYACFSPHKYCFVISSLTFLSFLFHYIYTSPFPPSCFSLLILPIQK
jgi:hypothetical protein